MLQDILFAFRMLGKNRTFTIVALATIAVGIGSTTAVFSVVDLVLIRPLPFPEPDRLVFTNDAGMRGPFDVLRAGARLAEYAAYQGGTAFTVRGRDLPERVPGAEVSANFFRVLGVHPLIGRAFTEGEDRPGRTRVAILSERFWRQQYSGRSDAIGKHIVLGEVDYEIAGVMPEGFNFPAAGTSVWVPMALDPRAAGAYWGSGGISVIARLRPGATLVAAQSELRQWIPKIRRMFPWRMPDAWGAGAQLTGLREQLVADARKRTLLLFGVVLLVLLMAVVNVANLWIGQASARRKEFGLRASLGASPGRLARQVFTEAVVMAIIAGALGIGLAFAQLDLLRHVLPPDTPRLAEVAIDWRILAFTAAITLGSGLLFGVLPALRTWSRPGQEIGAEGRSTVSALGLRTDASLVRAEAACATVLLVGAGLLLNSLWSMLHTERGFRVESVITAQVSPDRAAAGSLGKTVALFDRVRGQIAAYPGVNHVAAMNVLPLTPDVSAFAATVEDHPRPPQEPAYVLWDTAVTPEHLSALDIPLLQGRAFTAADRAGAPEVALVSVATARKFWPGQSPLGKRIKPVWLTNWRTIVGVVGEVKNYGISGPPAWVDGEIYLPLAQANGVPDRLQFVIRMAGGSASDLERTLPEMVHAVCGNCAVNKIATMASVASGAVEAPRSTAWLVGGFALLALTLASVGIYGVASHNVLRRTRELGVRLALGASRGHVAWQVAGSALRYTVEGAALGLGVSWLLTHWVRSLLYGVPEHDAASFSAAPVLLVAVSIAASAFPVWRAVRIDPAESLREG